MRVGGSLRIPHSSSRRLALAFTDSWTSVEMMARGARASIEEESAMGTRKRIQIPCVIRFISVAGACLLLGVAGGFADDPPRSPSVDPVQGSEEPSRVPGNPSTGPEL